MKNYNVYKHSDGKIEAVKKGWSWPGFFFSGIWALIKQLWVVAGLIFGFAIVSNYITMMFEPLNYYDEEEVMIYLWLSFIFSAIQLAIAVYLGAKGNELRETNLLKRGYTLLTNVNAENPDQAINLAIKQ